ncbi:hypothetical protein FZ934_03420 [Rhizobium grahamii]|uniref:Uncharacterized protein n=1 Tax=Rhizobium grahamii TaxID=1120045 RepID=A0A5Q0C2U1_9HYPH|nr:MULTISPECIES: hypothetical protein [Rhizobium]QFY59565.1 hypothetical protein FZ934_03420 [Rhizobium grahamii]QRM47912.1 hypothetical protein F3Y33_00460 [Rhizobium sp. BG6]
MKLTLLAAVMAIPLLTATTSFAGGHNKNNDSIFGPADKSICFNEPWRCGKKFHSPEKDRYYRSRYYRDSDRDYQPRHRPRYYYNGWAD